MVLVFGIDYSEYYDLLYRDKDYEKECDYIESLFDKFHSKRIRSIRDVACGTGGHAIPLAKRGYSVLGTDLSRNMVRIAQKKASDGKVENVDLKVADMRQPQPGRFDACLCMFASIGYLPSTEEVIAALKTMRKSLTSKGLLITDFWNGLAVMSIRPSPRTKTVHGKGFALTRRATPSLDPIASTCTVTYELTVRQETEPTRHFRESHKMRFFYPEEIRQLIACSGLELLSLHPFLNLRKRLSILDWNLTAVARRVT